MSNLKEKMAEQSMLNEADRLFNTYRKQFDLLERSLLSKTRKISAYDAYALGKQLESFQIYQRICEEQGNAGQLGRIPDIALDKLCPAKAA